MQEHAVVFRGAAIGTLHGELVDDFALAPHLDTFGEAADFLATRCPSRGAGGRPGWTRLQIGDAIRRLIREELGIGQYTEASGWHSDLGLD